MNVRALLMSSLRLCLTGSMIVTWRKINTVDKKQRLADVEFVVHMNIKYEHIACLRPLVSIEGS